MIFFGLRGVAPHPIFQAIATGLLGRGAFQGGAATVVLGVMLHLAIALAVVGNYYAVSRRIDTLRRHPLAWGSLYGITVYVVMNFVVIPLSAAGAGPRPWAVVINGILIHVFGVGIPSAWFARAAGPQSLTHR